MNKLLLIILTVTVSIFGCTNTENKENSDTQTTEVSDMKKGSAYIEDDESSKNILQVALTSKDHTTLVAAVQAAEVENAITNVGPLTVFAPVNSAFDALPAGTVENLLKPENKGALANILKYHVTPGNLSVDIIKKLKKLGQANNQNVQLEIDANGELLVGGAKILASIPASNGIIHVIDKVLLPPQK